MYKIPTNEQETVIQIDRNGDFASVWTSDQLMMNKLDKMVDNPDSPWELVEACHFFEDGVRTVATKEYKVPKEFISFRSKKRVVVLTEEQKQQRRENLAEISRRKSIKTEGQGLEDN